MGLETREQTIGPLNPSALIGRPDVIVEPSAVDAMTGALRAGFITADDILKRTGQLGKTKEKADLMSLNEAMSPDAQAARAAQTKLAGAQANATLPLVQPAGNLQLSMLEEQQAMQQYGPGIEYFKQFAPEAGVSAPVTADGKPDYAKRAEIGLQLFQWKQRQTQARERLVPVHWEKSPDGSNLFKFNKGGELITPELEQTLSRDAISTFGNIQPGAAAPAPAAQPAAAAQPPLTDQQRAQLVEQGGMSPVQATNAVPSDLSRLVQPSAPAAPAQQPTVRVPGSAAFLGAPKTAPAKPEDAIKAQEDLINLKSSLDTIQNARNVIKSGRNVVGPAIGTAGGKALIQIAAVFGIAEQEFKDQRDLQTAIADKIMDAAQRIRGPLSEKELAFVRQSVPQLTDNEPKWESFLSKWEQEIAQFIQIRQKQGGVSGGPTVPNSAPSNGASAPTGTPVTLSTGRKVVRGSDGQFYEVR